ncbi:uncharacterized protein [Arachis hypogaea]|uniref:Growth-regulating factor n=1 Tax=Arachis hypogaea TaxID=3818 RepID=A0A444WVK8_ARAHY|nr:growth-regulating factor 3-like [Arachis hypogaea]XP_025697970.1 growth-regulating factor 3-like [Arachis hypogaea]QHO40094.1 Growth-regulating factor [Arachis hypogaea]RYQ81425.1 hypothetical protein Ahy_Scaffold1g107356 [Arachis hypogaea]
MSVPPPHPPLPTAASMTWQAAPFTVAQWQELEHQALIFKYLKAGLTVPPDLLVPIRRSLQLMSQKLSHHYPSLGFYGKKIDPEPGRCRRTDGKKWRCSREAHPDSKYCDRHMIRRRYRSRKPVESSTSSQQQSHSSAAASAATAASTTTTTTTTTAASAASAAGGGGGGGGGGASGSGGAFHTLPLHTNGTREGFTLGSSNSSSLQNLHMDHPLSLPSEVSKKEYRFALNSDVDEHNFLQKDLGTVRYQGYDFTSDGLWSMPHIPSNTVSESRTGSTMVGDCFQQQTIRDADLLNLNASGSKELVFGSQLSPSSSGSLKQEYQSPQSLFTDWHWKKDLGSDAIYRPHKDFNSDANVDCNGSL